MATLLVDKRDQLFALNEMLGIDKLYEYRKFSDQAGFDMVLNEAHRFAKTEFYPTLQEGDEMGCGYNPKTIAVNFPECHKNPISYQKTCGLKKVNFNR